MKILICSDSHGDNDSLDKLVKKHPDMDYYLHAGDSEANELSITPFLSVKGNCDYFTDAPEYRILQTPFGGLLMKHTPYLPNGIISKENIRIFIHGHTHARKKEKIGTLYVLNPGSISMARDGNDYSYIILNIDKENIDVRFLTL